LEWWRFLPRCWVIASVVARGPFIPPHDIQAAVAFTLMKRSISGSINRQSCRRQYHHDCNGYDF
jgi:hypothetical protein